MRFVRNRSCGVRKVELSNEEQHLVRFSRNKSCGVRKCKNAHLSMRVFRCLWHPRRAAFATRPRLSPSPSGEGVARRFTARDERGAFAFIPARRPARPFINHQNKKPRHSVLRVFLHSHINKTKNAAPCASSSCAHKSPKQNTSPRAPPRAPLPLRKTKKRRAVRRADLMPYLAYKISHSETKNVFYFFPFQQ